MRSLRDAGHCSAPGLETTSRGQTVIFVAGRDPALQLAWELLFVQLSAGPGELRGLREADRVLVNYDSVRDLVRAACGDAVRFAKMAYAPETAFLRGEDEPVAPPDTLTGLEPGARRSSSRSRGTMRARASTFSCGH